MDGRLEARPDEGRLAALRRCLGKLDGPMRELVRLRYLEETPLADLGRLLDVHHSTLTMRLHRLRERLKACMEGREIP